MKRAPTTQRALWSVVTICLRPFASVCPKQNAAEMSLDPGVLVDRHCGAEHFTSCGWLLQLLGTFSAAFIRGEERAGVYFYFGAALGPFRRGL